MGVVSNRLAMVISDFTAELVFSLSLNLCPVGVSWIVATWVGSLLGGRVFSGGVSRLEETVVTGVDALCRTCGDAGGCEKKSQMSAALSEKALRSGTTVLVRVCEAVDRRSRSSSRETASRWRMVGRGKSAMSRA